MAYQINKTSGALLVNLADGQIDIASTDITLIGKNYTGFGESINENFVKMLENFSNTTAPANPLAGQLWWDSSNQKLKVYTGQTWATSGGTFVTAVQPSMVAGDIWINNETNQMYFYDGTDLTLAGPIYNNFQGLTGPQVVSVLDAQGTSRTIIKYWIGGTLVGVWSKLAFTPQNVDTIPGFTGDVAKGFNPVESDFNYQGTSLKTLSIEDSQGVSRTAEQFLASDSNDATSGKLNVRNNAGVVVGLSDNTEMKIVSNSFVAENQITNEDYKIRVRKQTGLVDAVVVKTANSSVGIFQSNPIYTLDVGGDLRVSGNLVVQGTSTALEAENLKVKDKNIQLGLPDDSTLLNDAAVDQGGIILESAQGSKDWLWRSNTNSWTSNVNIDLIAGSAIKMNGVEIIRGTDASGITALGALTTASIGNIQFTGGINMTTGATDSNGNGLKYTLAGHHNYNNQKITGVADPTEDQDVATKAYVDSAINTETIPLALDITGLTNSQVALVIEDIAPAATKQNGTEARIHCTDTTSATTVLPASALNSSFNKSLESVQKLDGSGNDDGSASVIGNATFTDVTGNVSLTVNRTLKLFRIVGGSWTYIQDLTSSV